MPRVSSNGAEIAVTEYGAAAARSSGPHVVLVHGFPDDQSLWNGVVARVPEVHAVTYDVRGAGRSSTPRGRRAYRTDRLADDLVAVVEATVPAGQSFHLVGHDWGSIQAWDIVTDARLAGRVASFVSASGPSVDHVAASLRGRPPKGLLRQLAHSFYLAAFQIPWLPERVWRSEHRLTPVILRIMAAEDGPDRWSPQLGRNGASGIWLYRANIVRKLVRPRPPRIDVPVLLVVATRDRLVGPAYLQAVGRYCTDLREVQLDAAHWHPRAQPELLAGVLRHHLGLDRASEAR